MELIRQVSDLRQRHRGCVVTIGTYDGIHLGHQALIRRLCEHGARLSRPTVAMTFEPMPREFLAPQSPPARLTSWRERWRLLERTPLESLLVMRFGESLRCLSGEQFAQLLARELQAVMVVVGHDFKFGRRGEANVPMLQGAAARLGFEVDVVAPVTLDGERVSSSGVRDALARGDLVKAERWLGRPYSMRGRVVRGAQLGRELGFPTANLRPQRRRAPLAGIFAARVHGTGAAGVAAVASIGTRPTIDGGGETVLEAHLFDFSGDLYGLEIEVEFVSKLREEEKFPDLQTLVAQMHRDAEAARRLLRAVS